MANERRRGCQSEAKLAVHTEHTDPTWASFFNFFVSVAEGRLRSPGLFVQEVEEEKVEKNASRLGILAPEGRKQLSLPGSEIPLFPSFVLSITPRRGEACTPARPLRSPAGREALTHP